MIEKYDPDHIITKTWERFSGFDEYKDSEVHDFKVYIEIKESDQAMYIIGGYQNNFFLLKDTLRSSKTTITSTKNLAKDKARLGRVHVEFKKERVKIYKDYDEFWSDIKRE